MSDEPIRGRSALEVLTHVVRLYDDAKILFRNESFATAGALAILALEETAKFLSLAGIQPLEGSSRDHVVKHVGAASFLLRKRYQQALRELLADRGKSEEYARLAQIDLETTEDPLIWEMIDDVLERITKDKSLMRFAHAYDKRFDRLKQRCLYVDLNPDGSVASSPQQVTKDEATEALEVMQQVLMQIRISLPKDQ
jgi:AbiV family abortive infection protein